MSQPYYAWLRLEGFKILGVTAEEQMAVEERRDVFCSVATKEIVKFAGDVPNPMDLFERMPREQKIGFAEKTVNDGLVILGIRKKKEMQEIEDEVMQAEISHRRND